VIDSNGVLRLRAEVEALKDQLAHAHKYWHHDLDVLDKAWAEVEALKATCERREVLRVEALKRAVTAESELAVLKDAAARLEARVAVADAEDVLRARESDVDFGTGGPDAWLERDAAKAAVAEARARLAALVKP
jgi:hypothetical protein